MASSIDIPELEELFPTGPERIQKLLARAGFGSRRKCEGLITQGRVKVDGAVVKELGAKAALETQTVEVDGRIIRPEERVYYLLNKPKGVLCTVDDPLGRQTVLSFFPEEDRRIFPVGRLDLDSKGAVILTNDGRLTQLLTHPRYGVDRTYEVRVRGAVSDYALNQLRKGIRLSEGLTSPAEVWITSKREDETELALSIHEGWNRQVRRMLAAVDHKVRSLTRVRIGSLAVKGLALGEARRLTRKEIQELVKIARKNESPPPPRRRGGKTTEKRLGKPDPRVAQEQHAARQARNEAWSEELGERAGDDAAATSAPRGGRGGPGPKDSRGATHRGGPRDSRGGPRGGRGGPGAKDSRGGPRGGRGGRGGASGESRGRGGPGGGRGGSGPRDSRGGRGGPGGGRGGSGGGRGGPGGGRGGSGGGRGGPGARDSRGGPRGGRSGGPTDSRSRGGRGGTRRTQSPRGRGPNQG